MKTLSIDIETYSGTDLIKSGVYKYVEDPAFEILLFAYAFGDEPVWIVDLASGEPLPEVVRKALTDPKVLKTAHNANFEITCISKHFNIKLLPDQWECTQMKVAMLGLPLALEAVAKVLNLAEQKDAAGKALIRYFSIPCKPSKVNGGRTRNLPEHSETKWHDFKNYCIQDVVVERDIKRKISFFQIPEQEKQLWNLDQLINDRGVLLDPVLVANAIQLDTSFRVSMTEESARLTGLDNPNSVAQLKKWLTEETGDEVVKLTKESVPALLKSVDSAIVEKVLQIRQQMAKTSVKKYESMRKVICTDNRVRGLLQFYGANRTGRWAGRLIQVQNLPRIELKDLDLARETVLDADLDMLGLLFGNVLDTLSQLIRTSFIAPEGHRLIVADFSAIEARVIAWLAGENWRLEVFKTHGKIYEASAAQMFKVPIESIDKSSPLRQKGKVSELALGYQGGPNALVNMGALKMGLEKKELPKLVKMWRNANPAIVNLWAVIDEASIKCVRTKETVKVNHGIEFSLANNILHIKLPSGRKLAYLRPKLKMTMMVFFKFSQDHENFVAEQTTTLSEKQAHFFESQGFGEISGEPFEKQSITYEGMNQTTKQWGIQNTYGGKLVENIVQAIARDCLAVAMLRLHAADYKIVMHVHDEVINEMPYGNGSTEEVNEIMGKPIPWAKGLPLTAESYETLYYKKD
jgi:DNA polymerase